MISATTVLVLIALGIQLVTVLLILRVIAHMKKMNTARHENRKKRDDWKKNRRKPADYDKNTPRGDVDRDLQDLNKKLRNAEQNQKKARKDIQKGSKRSNNDRPKSNDRSTNSDRTKNNDRSKNNNRSKNNDRSRSNDRYRNKKKPYDASRKSRKDPSDTSFKKEDKQADTTAARSDTDPANSRMQSLDTNAATTVNTESKREDKERESTRVPTQETGGTGAAQATSYEAGGQDTQEQNKSEQTLYGRR